ncbi:Xylose isomerase-like TIM barrel [Pirellulimonas nuda]|uniref:Xylose isomerase-like TIM barrel n=1 Tax=Pirellulimonas nuda TaxID=2528009 RepID=A0A518DJD4_9BACT|nr:sugar phosphate isomerase/epimerase family protein [Pirellulimonas nuda]QDU91583.1 Xylose isomerase-like TIM barrel [Pirellulimonas nuda]
MPTHPIGIQLASLAAPLRRGLALASQLGADGVEIDLRTGLPAGDVSQTAARELRKLLADQNLKVSAAAFPTRRSLADPEELDRRIAALREATRAAARLGARVLVVRAGRIPSEDESDARQTLIHSLTAIASTGDREGVVIALETGHESPADLATLLDELPMGLVGADLHPARLLSGGHAPLEAAGALGPRIVHVHAADAVHDFAERRVVEVELGRGAVDFPEIVGALEQFDYRGWITIERRHATRPVEEIGDAVAFLRSLH